MEKDYENPVLNKILGLFQTYQKTGQCSRLVLETMGGALFANLSVQCPTWPASPGRTSSSTQRKRSRRITPSRRKRNQARREEWLARKNSKSKDTSNSDVGSNVIEKKQDEVEENNCDEPILTETSEEEVALNNPRQIICVMKEALENTNSQDEEVIEQIDGNIESVPVTYDLTISAMTDLDAFCSIEENLCSAEDSPRIPFISDIPSEEETDENNPGNTLFTMEIKVENERNFLAKVEKTFRNWEPLWYGKPRGTLVRFKKRI